MQEYLNKFLLLEDIYKYLIFTGVWIVIGLLLYFFMISPQLEEIEKKRTEYIKLKKKTSMIVKVHKRLKKFKKQFEEVKVQYKLAIKKLPNTREIPKLLLKISKYGNENNLNFLLFKPKKEIAKEFYAIIPISLKFTGNYANSGNFFYQIGKTTRIVKVKDFTISKRRNDKIYINANLETYKFLKNVKKKPKKRKK